MRQRSFSIVIISLAALIAAPTLSTQLSAMPFADAGAAIALKVPGSILANDEDRHVLSNRWLDTNDNDLEKVDNPQTSHGASFSAAVKHGPPRSIIVGENVNLPEIAIRFHPLRTSRRSPPVATGSPRLP